MPPRACERQGFDEVWHCCWVCLRAVVLAPEASAAMVPSGVVGKFAAAAPAAVVVAAVWFAAAVGHGYVSVSPPPAAQAPRAPR